VPTGRRARWRAPPPVLAPHHRGTSLRAAKLPSRCRSRPPTSVVSRPGSVVARWADPVRRMPGGRPGETNRISANENPTLSTSVVVPGGLPRSIPCLQQYQNPYKTGNKWSTTFIYYINQSTSLRLMPGTSPSGLNQTERYRLAVASCKCGRLHIRRQLERRKSSNHPIHRCRSRSPALCQRHQDLHDKWVGHVSFPTKKQSGVYSTMQDIILLWL
jgi:hypothetical protein